MLSLIEKIKSRSHSIKEQREVFVTKLEELNTTLSEYLGGIELRAQSSQVELEQIGPDDWTYGYLCFSRGKLKVSYRTTHDDYDDEMNHVPDEYQSYKMIDIGSCSVKWLEKLSSDNQINNLLKNIERTLSSIESNTVGSIESLTKALNFQSEGIATETQDVLSEYSYSDLPSQWEKARRYISSDPSDSITRSSSYLESVCRLILHETGEPFPNKKDITSLIGSAVKALELSENAEANDDLKKLFSGIKSIFQAVGAMRTHFGTAHGSTPGDYVANEDYARLVNNASATASIYLLQRLKKKLNRSIQPIAD